LLLPLFSGGKRISSNVHQVQSQSNDWQAKQSKSLGAYDLNRIANFG
jgi:hypothetical protein